MSEKYEYLCHVRRQGVTDVQFGAYIRRKAPINSQREIVRVERELTRQGYGKLLSLLGFQLIKGPAEITPESDPAQHEIDEIVLGRNILETLVEAGNALIDQRACDGFELEQIARAIKRAEEYLVAS